MSLTVYILSVVVTLFAMGAMAKTSWDKDGKLTVQDILMVLASFVPIMNTFFAGLILFFWVVSITESIGEITVIKKK